MTFNIYSKHEIDDMVSIAYNIINIVVKVVDIRMELNNYQYHIKYLVEYEDGKREWVDERELKISE